MDVGGGETIPWSSLAGDQGLQGPPACVYLQAQVRTDHPLWVIVSGQHFSDLTVHRIFWGSFSNFVFFFWPETLHFEQASWWCQSSWLVSTLWEQGHKACVGLPPALFPRQSPRGDRSEIKTTQRKQGLSADSRKSRERDQTDWLLALSADKP